MPVMARTSMDGRFSEDEDATCPSVSSSDMPRLLVDATYGILGLLRLNLERDRVEHFRIV